MNIAAAFGEIVRFLRLHRWIGLVAIVLSASAAASVAHAFTDPQYFYKKALEGGTEGRWFTGSPADGYSCNVCHTGGQAETLVVEGLPKDGYSPKETYDIRISWPATAARTYSLYDTQPQNALPRAELVAELIAESTGNSGKIEQLNLGQLAPGELCHGQAKRYGYGLYRQRVGKPAEPSAVCIGENLTRCLIAVRGCGSQEVHIKWTAPDDYEGPIWFSAAFVSTDRVSSTPEDDQASEIAIPIAPAGASGYASVLKQSSCSVVSGPGADRSRTWGSALAMVAVACVVRRRRGARSRRLGARS